MSEQLIKYQIKQTLKMYDHLTRKRFEHCIISELLMPGIIYTQLIEISVNALNFNYAY